jgi:integrase
VHAQSDRRNHPRPRIPRPRVPHGFDILDATGLPSDTVYPILRRVREARRATALIAAADPIVDRTILTVAIYSGLRRGELFGLFWKDIDWSAGRISVRRSILGEMISSPKTKNSIRPGDLGNFIFRKQNGKPLVAEHWAQKVLPRLCRKAGIRRITLRDMRHTYASLLINQGENIKYVSHQMGRGSMQVTGASYAHLFDETSKAAMDRLEKRMEDEPRA